MIDYKIKYPKLVLFVLSIVIAIALFNQGNNSSVFQDFILSFGFIGIFLGGFFYSYGFTSAPATAVLLVFANDYNLILAVLIGSTGALISDVLIFKFVRYSFMDEINNLKKEKSIKKIEKQSKKFFGVNHKYITYFISSFLIASPLPTEIGVSMMASIKKISLSRFMIIAYLLHTLGILMILLIGNII